jgi:peptidoglycan-associated lipoprotein
MGWPQGGSGGVLRCCALVAAALALVTCVDSSAGKAWADPPSPPSASPFYGPDQRAEELYLDGVEKLAAGHADFARQTFESVISRYPATEAAEYARRDLALLKADVGAGAGESSDSFGSVAVTGALPSFSSEPEAAAQPARPPLPAWDGELRRNASIQSKLRIEAGDRVFFSSGSAELGSRARAAINAQAQWLKRWNVLEAAIEGHSDEPGSEQENVELSQLRAEAVRERLIAEGVEPNRIAVVPLGRSVRVATCSDTDCRAQNRRAVTLVFATGTRERLGLVGATPLPTAFAPAAAGASVAGSPATASVSQAVGVTR